jgi:hypothetical protein
LPSPRFERRAPELSLVLLAAVLLCGTVLSSCQSISHEKPAPADTRRAPAASTPGATDSPTPSEREVAIRRQMFAGLVSDIRKFHVFSSVWPEAEWAKDLPALEREVLNAPDRGGLLLALRHVSNSLRDGHLAFTPWGSNAREDVVTLPVTFASAGDTDPPWFVVTRSDRQSGASRGDFLLTYDGVPREKLLERFRFELNAATPAARVNQLSRFLQRRHTLGLAPDGVRIPTTLQHGAHVVRAELELQRPALAPGAEGDAVQSRAACPAPASEYDAAYELVEAGIHVCMYRASGGPFGAYPIIWHGSFLYDRTQRAADRERVQRFLASTPDIAGVVLDLRDNGGGIAADYILPWYGSGAYQGLNEWVHVHPELEDRARLRTALRSESAVGEYLRRASNGDRWWVRPFDCGSEPCRGTQTQPVVGSAPVALLLGPGCRSACDAFATLWTRARFGPTIGSAPAGMYTSLRYPLELKLDDEPLGDFTIALCGLRFDANDRWLEGEVLPVGSSIERSWPFADYGQKLLRAAVAALIPWRAKQGPPSERTPGARHRGGLSQE